MPGIVAKRIKECRELQGLSMTKLAEKTGLTISAISQFESDGRDPNLDSLNKLANALGVTADYLMGRDDNIPAMFRGFQNMTPKDKEDMLHFYQFLRAKENRKKEKGNK